MLPPILSNLRLPVVASPMFIVSGPDLVIAQCKAGIVGSFPALNAREADGEPPLLDAWLTVVDAPDDRARARRLNRLLAVDRQREQPERVLEPGVRLRRGDHRRPGRGRLDALELALGIVRRRFQAGGVTFDPEGEFQGHEIPLCACSAGR